MAAWGCVRRRAAGSRKACCRDPRVDGPASAGDRERLLGDAGRTRCSPDRKYGNGRRRSLNGSNSPLSPEEIWRRYSPDYFWKEYLPSLGVHDGQYDLTYFDAQYAAMLKLT